MSVKGSNLAVVAGDGIRDDAKAIIAQNRSSEVFFGVVGPVGAGSSRVMSSLARAAKASGYTVIPIKASELIRQWAQSKGLDLPDSSRRTLDTVSKMQDLGDAMRRGDSAAVARAIVQRIAEARADAMGLPYVKGKAVKPDQEKRAYLIDSIRHPAEIQLLRRTYANAFALIGVVCQEDARRDRVLGKYFTDPEKKILANIDRVAAFISRDADDPSAKNGQHVADAFHEADFFVDNTINDPLDEKSFLNESLGRLLNIIAHDEVRRPTIEETAMHHAHSARVRSACMSRQVGAALMDQDGTVVATGVNEVPKAGGGVYGENFDTSRPPEDHRCVFRSTKYCSSNREQNSIIEELIGQIDELKDVADKEALAERIRSTRLGGLIEFSRAVHAEMDAVISAGRQGVSTIGARLFVTTFPCHYCARHIVSAGIYQVQYIEPYPKSRALALHDDAIEINPSEWAPPEIVSVAEERRRNVKPLEGKKEGKVLFSPFVGVAPRLYERAFEKTWRLKNRVTGDFEMSPPEWGDGWAPFTLAYPELEATLTQP